MKLSSFFFFIAALFIVGTSAQQQSNIPAEIQAIIDDLNVRASVVANEFANSLQSAANVLASSIQVGWTFLRTLFSLATASPSFLSTVDSAINETIYTLIIDFDNGLLRNAYLDALQVADAIYRSALQKYSYWANATSGVYQCWNASRPEIVRTVKTFVNITKVQTKPLVDNLRTYINQQWNVTYQNFSSYQRNVPGCGLFFLASFRTCRENYWASVSPQILASFREFRSNVRNKRNETVQAIKPIITNNANIARTDLQAIDMAFEACVNATITTTAAPTTAAPTTVAP